MTKALEIASRRAKIKDVNEISQEEINRRENMVILKKKVYDELDPLSASNRRVRKYILSGKSLSPKDQERYEANITRAKELCEQLDNLKI